MIKRKCTKSNEIKALKINIYSHKCTVSSDGYVERSPGFYAVFENQCYWFGTHLDETYFVKDLVNAMSRAVEKNNSLKFSIMFPDCEERINTFLDGYFGRPAIHENSINLKPINKKMQKQLKRKILEITAENKLEDRLII